MKRKIMLFTVIVIFLVGCYVFYNQSTKIVDKTNLGEQNNSNITENEQELTENVEKEETTDYDSDKNVENTEASTDKQETLPPVETPKPTKEESKPTNTPASTNVQPIKPQETPNPSPSNEPTPSPTPQPVETPKEETKDKPWDKLGISEYDYYHKPILSWMTIDFVLNGTGNNSCSSMQDCRKKCEEYGNKYTLEHSGGYYCNEVNSYSGDYLGENFDYFELKD